jgi:hypothetical protein
MASPAQRRPVRPPEPETVYHQMQIELSKITSQLQNLDRTLGYINGALQKIANKPS